MQLFQFQTPRVFLKRYFQNNPEKLKSYVQVGLVAAKIVVAPLSAVLKHLIEVQGMDPNTEPGRRMREEFDSALNLAFQQFHDHEYDTNFDFSWLNKKFEEACKSKGQSFDLSKEKFRELTDISSLKSVAPSFAAPATRTTTEAGIPVTIDQSPLDDLSALLGVSPVNQITPEPAEQARDFFFTQGKLEDALEKLVMIAKDLEDEGPLDPKELFAKTEYLKKVKKELEQYSVPARPIKKAGKVHRTKTGDTKAVKETPRKSPKPTKRSLNKITGAEDTKVQKEAEVINNLIAKGRLQVSDVDELVRSGLDQATVDYWKKNYNPGKDLASLERLEKRAEKSDHTFKSNRGSFRRVPTKR